LNATQPFGACYADVYDALYADKDYAGECDLIEEIFARRAAGRVRSVLDLGCGTGRHASLLAQRGYDVLGVDRSPPMIERAQAAGDAAKYAVADLRTFRTDRRFDAALMMFAVLGYQLEDADVIAALRTARTHLVDSGLLLFDCWYGPAVMHQRPSDRMKTAETPDGPVRRKARSSLDVSGRRIRIAFDVERGVAGAVERSRETHEVRFFFEEDIERFLSASGFGLVRMGVMPEFDRGPDESTWNVLVCARAATMMGA